MASTARAWSTWRTAGWAGSFHGMPTSRRLPRSRSTKPRRAPATSSASANRLRGGLELTAAEELDARRGADLRGRVEALTEAALELAAVLRDESRFGVGASAVALRRARCGDCVR